MPTKTPVLRTIPARQPTPVASAAAPKSRNIERIGTKCSNCCLRELCPPCCGLTPSEMDVANRLAFNRRGLRRGASLYRSGDHFSSLYAVRDGFFKSTILLADGRPEQVTGFAMAGEVLGVDGIATERHTCNAIALEDSEVCILPFARLEDLARELPGLERQFLRTMSGAIVRDQGALLLLGSLNADERVATFLLNLSQRFAAHGGSPSSFNMRMTREEIGSFLALRLETVSRSLSKFEEEGLLSVQRKFVHILDHAGLARVMGRQLR